MLAKTRRITKDLVEQVVKQGRSYHSPAATLKVLPSTGNTLFGFVVSKKVSKKAVDRNFIKRRARHIVYKQSHNLKEGYLCVMMFKPLTKELSFTEMESEVVDLLKKANILK